MQVMYLRSLGDLPGSRILSFFDGVDPQNVPKASALLTHLHRASQLSALSSRPEHKPFILLGEVLGSFVLPFTTPTMSLAEQITSLVKCAHLLFALYRIDGTRFLPGQLIYDIQASIKNAVFCVAKAQLTDASAPFYLLQTGTDRLETRFGTYRTTSSDRNGDILQMCERAASAQHIDGIFSEHPSWNRAPYRLSLDGKSGVDHTNPASWVGDVTVGHVDLRACWIYGRSQAAEALTRAGMPFEFDPMVLALESGTIDLMRPCGQYPGIQVDNTEPDLSPVSLSDLTGLVETTDAELSETTNSSGSDHSLDALLHIGDDELSIEHILPPTLEMPAPQTSKKGWILVEGKWVHLESAVRYLLGSEGGSKSTDRLRRVCGLSRYLHSSSNESESVLGEDFHVLDLVATFLRVDNRIVIAIIRVTNISTKDGRSVEAISAHHFADPGITLSGQLLELEFDSGVWYWTQRYDSAAGSTASAHRKRHSGFDIGARFACPVNPALIERDGDRVWAFEHSQMNALMNDLWKTCAAYSPEDHIPVCESSASYPYGSSDRECSMLRL
jgi:hypothetical protein